MTQRLQQLLEQVQQLEPTEQDAIAEKLAQWLEELEAEKRWNELLNDPEHAAAVDALAEEALAEFKAGKSYPLSDVFGDESL